MRLTTDMPSVTRPNTTCLPSAGGHRALDQQQACESCPPTSAHQTALAPAARCATADAGPRRAAAPTKGCRGSPSQGQGAVVMKNWEPLVPGPALAMDSSPPSVCFRSKFSSANVSPEQRAGGTWGRDASCGCKRVVNGSGKAGGTPGGSTQMSPSVPAAVPAAGSSRQHAAQPHRRSTGRRCRLRSQSRRPGT